MSAVAILYANLKGNIGDFAILEAMLRDIAERHPNWWIDVYPQGFLPVDRYRIAAFIDEGVPSFALQRGTYVPVKPLGLRLARKLGRLQSVQEARIALLAWASRADARRFDDYEVIYLAGGDQWEGPRGISMFGTLEALSTRKAEIVAYPFSIRNNVLDYNHDSNLRRYFKAIRSPLPMRDESSVALMQGIGIPAVFRADCVIGLAGEACRVAARPGVDPDRVLLAPVARGRDFVSGLRSLLRDLVGCGKRVTLMTTCEVADGRAYRTAAAETATEVLAPLTWREAVAEMRSSRLVVTNRFHGLLFGAMAGVPLLPISDRAKSASFAMEASMPVCLSRLRDLSAERLAAALLQSDKAIESAAGYVARAQASSG